MSKTPKIPVDQTRAGGEGQGGAPADRRDLSTGLQSGQPGDADANLDQQGRFGNLNQNLTTQNKSGNR